MGCVLEPNDGDDRMLREAANGEKFSPGPGISEILQALRSEVQQRIEDLGKERVERQLTEIPKHEFAKEPSPEKIEKILRDEFHAAPKATRNEIYGYKYVPQPSGRGFDGLTWWDKFTGKAHIEVYKGNDMLQTIETVTHEFWEVEYERLTTNQVNELKVLYLEAMLGVEGKVPISNCAWENERQYFCESMAKFKWDPETLKEKDQDMFNFCKEIYLSREIERIKEELGEGGFIFFPV